MGVAGQILQHVFGSAKRGLCVNYPIGLLKYPQPGLKASGVCGGSQVAAELAFSSCIGGSQEGPKLPAEEAPQDPHRQEELLAATNPTRSVRCDPSCWNHAV